MSTSPDSPSELPFVSHLLELRDRLLRTVLVVMVIFLGLFPFANDIYTFIADPLMAVLPSGTSMIATQVASPFLTPFKLSLVAAVFLSMPFILYQLWAFIAPGLYQHERKMAMPLVASSILLFYAGAAFAYFVVFPLVFAFLTSMAPEGVAVMTDISAYLDFVLTLFFAFGLSFEVPIATIILVWMGMTTPQQLGAKRPYIIVGAFVLGMLLTPPDVISQTLLALPIWLLFEVGVFFSRAFVRKPANGDDDLADEIDDSAPDASGHSGDDPDPGGAPAEGFQPLSEAEMDAELDRMDAEEFDEIDPAGRAEASAVDLQAGVDAKLERVVVLRDNMEFDVARRLLHEVLAEGDEAQRAVARNILAQMDGDA